MKYLQEFRDPRTAGTLVEAIKPTASRPWKIMEVCGGQTHSALKYGIDQLLDGAVELIHGPGCPVCVTPVDTIDKALAIASTPGVIFCSFGDMLRVPGSQGDLLGLKAKGADIRIVYSPLDALKLAEQNPDRPVVFFGAGFETTAPITALAAHQARQLNLGNFLLLVCHMRVPPVMEALLNSPGNRIQAFLGAGHVCTVMGYQEYLPIAASHRVPIVITGFEPVDLLQGLYQAVRQLEEGRSDVENEYRRAVKPEGNRHAQDLLQKVFDTVDRRWRGLGAIPDSGLALNAAFDAWNAEQRFPVTDAIPQEPPLCRSGEVLQGLIKPTQCPEFGVRCTPEKPLGATMVSSEGACAAYFHYRGHSHV